MHGEKETRFALAKNPWNLTQPKHEKLSGVTNPSLYRTYLPLATTWPSAIGA